MYHYLHPTSICQNPRSIKAIIQNLKNHRWLPGWTTYTSVRFSNHWKPAGESTFSAAELNALLAHNLTVKMVKWEHLHSNVI